MVIRLYIDSFEFSNGNISFSVPSIIKKFIPYRNKTLKINYKQEDLEIFRKIIEDNHFLDEQIILYLLENHHVKLVIYLDKFHLMSYNNHIFNDGSEDYEFEGMLSRRGIHIFVPRNN